ncbi:MAG: hypothetical protein R3Y68_08515 [Rikenellaceae bacterium]
MAKKEIKEISLTDFIDFVNKSGNAKLTKVRSVKYRPQYESFSDYYKPIREGIVKAHKADCDKGSLDEIITKTKDPKKLSNYRAIITGYKKFWGTKNLSWIAPPFEKWTEGDLTIRINPEVALEQKSKDGKSTFYVIKFYFKEDTITKYQVDQILTLMEYKLRKKVKEPEVIFALLDTRKGKLHIKRNNELKELPLLKGEFVSFATMWDMI